MPISAKGQQGIWIGIGWYMWMGVGVADMDGGSGCRWEDMTYF